MKRRGKWRYFRIVDEASSIETTINTTTETEMFIETIMTITTTEINSNSSRHHHHPHIITTDTMATMIEISAVVIEVMIIIEEAMTTLVNQEGAAAATTRTTTAMNAKVLEMTILGTVVEEEEAMITDEGRMIIVEVMIEIVGRCTVMIVAEEEATMTAEMITGK